MKKVIVVPYDEMWKTEFKKIKEELISVLNGYIVSIEHGGSTSVEGLAAKPVISNNKCLFISFFLWSRF